MGAAKHAPIVFLPHGAGPWPLLESGYQGIKPTTGPWGRPEHAGLVALLRGWGASHPKPRAALVISAHYSERVPSIVGSNRSPPMLYDYGDFPPAAYRLTYKAPGAPDLAKRVGQLLSQAGVASKQDFERGYDHGTFVTLGVAWPQADVPLAVLSLDASLDPEVHLRMGEALAPLREEGVAIVGSGQTFHNQRAMLAGRQARHEAAAEAFDAYLQESLTSPQLDAAARRARLAGVLAAPGAAVCQPAGHEEHLLPLLVAAGAARCGRAASLFSEPMMGYRTSAFEWA